MVHHKRVNIEEENTGEVETGDKDLVDKKQMGMGNQPRGINRLSSIIKCLINCTPCTQHPSFAHFLVVADLLQNETVVTSLSVHKRQKEKAGEDSGLESGHTSMNTASDTQSDSHSGAEDSLHSPNTASRTPDLVRQTSGGQTRHNSDFGECQL